MDNLRLLPAALLLASSLSAGLAHADVTPHELFSDGAVLQRDTEVPVWGFSTREGEKVSVALDDKPAVATVAKDGKWMVKLPASPAGGPHTLTITGDNTVVRKDILFGEVWICAGQSNMEMNFAGNRHALKPADGEAVMKTTALPALRLFNVRNTAAPAPLDHAAGQWMRATPENLKDFSFVGQCFGRDLVKALGDVPVGLIEADWGGTCAETWMSRAALEKLPAVAKMLKDFDDGVKARPAALAEFKAQQEAHAKAVAQAKVEKKPAPAAPKAPGDRGHQANSPATLYNGMIAPLIPYALRGAIWYQGESNNGRAKDYAATFPTLIADWRTAWGRGDFPFLFVQIAPFKGMSPEIREAQFLAQQTTPNTAMVQTIDVGDANDIHPTRKEPVGQRLALAARRLAYGEAKLEYSGPLFAGAAFADGKAVVAFTHADAGLELKDAKAGDFQLAGADGKFHPATAAVEDGKLVVSSPEVPAPAAVRYGWSNVPNAALWNKDGLPASPFRSDAK